MVIMGQNRPLSASMLTDYITATRPVTSEDGYGELSVTSITNVASFWADIKELKEVTTVSQGKKRRQRIIEITARRRDVQDLEVDDEVTFGNSGDTYQVNDVYESDWKYGQTIIAQYKQ